MDPDRDVKKLRHVVRLHKSFKSQKNGDINRSRSVLWWGRKGINNRIWKDMCPFKNGYTIYYWLQILEPFFRFLIDPFFLQCGLSDCFSCRCFPILDGLLLISSKYIRGPRVDITWSSYGRPLLRDSRLRVDIDPLDRVIQPTSFTAAGAIWHIPLWESHKVAKAKNM